MNRPLLTIKALASLAALIGLVVGLPWLLVTTIGNPLPDSIPSFAEVERLLTQNGAGFEHFLIGVLAAFVWVIWLQLTLALIVESVAMARGSAAPRLPAMPGLQTTVARLVASIAIALTLLSGPLAPTAQALTLTGLSQVSEPYRPPPSGFTVADSWEAQPIAPGATIVLSEAVTFWDLAEAIHHDGVRWRDVLHLNHGMVMADGTVLDGNIVTLEAGWRLEVPADADLSQPTMFRVETDAGGPEAPEPATSGTMSAVDEAVSTAAQAQSDADAAAQTLDEPATTVRPGDNLWELSRESLVSRLGREPTNEEIRTYWMSVVEVNLGTLSSGDADLIYPGETVTIPPFDAMTGGHDRTGLATLPAAIAPATAGDRSPTPDQAEANGGIPATLIVGASGASAATDTSDRSDNAFKAIDTSDNATDTSDTGNVDTGNVDTGNVGNGVATFDTGGTNIGIDATAKDRDIDANMVTDNERGTDAEAMPANTLRQSPRSAEVSDDPLVAVAGPSAAGRTDTGEGEDAGPGIGLAALAGLSSSVAAASLWQLTRRRAAQQRRRRHGQPIALDDHETERLAEAQIRAIAETDTLGWICAAQNGLAGRTIDHGLTPPAPEFLRVGRCGLELHFAGPAPAAPPGFVALGEVWSLDERITRLEVEAATAGYGPLMPALFTVGAQDGDTVLLDLERAGMLAIRCEDPDHRVACMNSIVLELGTAPWAEHVQVIAVGGDPELNRLDSVTVPSDDTWLPRVLRLAEETSELTLELGSTHAARCLPDAGDSFSPVVVIILDDEIDPALAAAAGSRSSGLAVVAFADITAPWSIDIAGSGAAILNPVGLRMQAAMVSPVFLRSLLENLQRAGVDDNRLDPDAPVDWGVPIQPAAGESEGTSGPRLVIEDGHRSPVLVDVSEAAPGQAGETPMSEELQSAREMIERICAPCGVELTVFGAPRLSGDLTTKATRRDVEITALLSLKANPPTVGTVTEAIFNRGALFLDDQDAPAPKTVLSALSRTRATLGETASGERRLPRGSKDGAGYELVDVGVDRRRCETVIELARGTSDQMARQHLLHAALTLVSGRPFDDIVDDSYGWAFGDRKIASRIEAVTTEAAMELADLALAAGDADLAGWAAERGVTVVRGHADLYRRMMRAYALRDGADGARRAYAEFERVLYSIDPDEEVDDETAELLAELVNGEGSSGTGRHPTDPADIVALSALASR